MVESVSNRQNATVLFDVIDHTGVLHHLKFGSRLVIVFGFFLTVCIAWCNGGKKAKYIKKNPLSMRSFPPIPVQKKVEMKAFVPKFIALSYRSEDPSNRSTEHIYESID